MTQLDDFIPTKKYRSADTSKTTSIRARKQTPQVPKRPAAQVPSVALAGDIAGADAFCRKHLRVTVVGEQHYAQALVVASRKDSIPPGVMNAVRLFASKGKPVLLLTTAGVFTLSHARIAGLTITPVGGEQACRAKWELLLALGVTRPPTCPPELHALQLPAAVSRKVSPTRGERVYLNEAAIARAVNPGQETAEGRRVELAERKREIELGHLRKGAGKRAGEWVAAYVAEHGQGPTWTELWAGMGWGAVVGQRTQQGRTLMRGFKRRGWLTYELELERSLRPGPAIAAVHAGQVGA